MVDAKRWRTAVLVIFAACGIGMASWVARGPAVRDALHATTLQMGLLLFAIAVGSIVGLLASGHLVERFGAAQVIGLALPLAAAGFIAAGLTVALPLGFIWVGGGLIVFGIGYSITDVAMNVSGAANERALGRAIMPVFHAFFSVGTVLGAGLGVLAELLHVPLAVHIPVVGVLIAAVGLLAPRYLEHEARQTDEMDAAPATFSGRLSVWRDPRTLLIGVIALGMAFAEGSANDWLALSVVDGVGTTNSTGALVFGVFVASMTTARLGGVKLLDRFGRVPVLRVSAALAVVGLVLFIFVPNLGVAILGVVLWGFGAALGFPVAMSAAADDPRTAAARVSAVATIGYFAFLVGPPAIGFLGEQFGLLRALLLVVLLVTIAGLVSGAAKETKSAA